MSGPRDSAPVVADGDGPADAADGISEGLSLGGGQGVVVVDAQRAPQVVYAVQRAQIGDGLAGADLKACADLSQVLKAGQASDCAGVVVRWTDRQAPSDCRQGLQPLEVIGAAEEAHAAVDGHEVVETGEALEVVVLLQVEIVTDARELLRPRRWSCHKRSSGDRKELLIATCVLHWYW